MWASSIASGFIGGYFYYELKNLQKMEKKPEFSTDPEILESYIRANCKKGWHVNPNHNGILKGLIRCEGECPCANTGETLEDRMCPCKNYREDDYCCCNLYIKD